MNESIVRDLAERKIFRKLVEEGIAGTLQTSTQRWNEKMKRWEVTIHVTCTNPDTSSYTVHVYPAPCVVITDE